MPNLTINPADVIPYRVSPATGLRAGWSGEAFVAGQAAYFDEVDQTMKLARADQGSMQAKVAGITTHASAVGQPINLARRYRLAIGGAGGAEQYVLSDTPGSICLTTDLANGSWVVPVGQHNLGDLNLNLQAQPSVRKGVAGTGTVNLPTTVTSDTHQVNAIGYVEDDYAITATIPNGTALDANTVISFSIPLSIPTGKTITYTIDNQDAKTFTFAFPNTWLNENNGQQPQITQVGVGQQVFSLTKTANGVKATASPAPATIAVSAVGPDYNALMTVPAANTIQTFDISTPADVSGTTFKFWHPADLKNGDQITVRWMPTGLTITGCTFSFRSSDPVNKRWLDTDGSTDLADQTGAAFQDGFEGVFVASNGNMVLQFPGLNSAISA